MRKEKKERMLKKMAGVVCAGMVIAGVTSLVPTNTPKEMAQASSRDEVVYVQIEDEKVPLAYTDLSDISASENKDSVDGYEEDILSAGRIVE